MLSNRLYRLLALSAMAILVLGLGSCSQDKQQTFGWGESDYYDDFLWCKYTPDTLHRTLEFDLNRDARMFLERDVMIGLYSISEDGQAEPLSTEIAQLFVEGKPCLNNIIIIDRNVPPESDAAIVFNPKAPNKDFNWCFKVVNPGDLDRISTPESTYDLQGDSPQPEIFQFDIAKHGRMNPLARTLMIIGCAIAALLLLWFLVIERQMYPRFSALRLTVEGYDSYLTNIPLKGLHRVVLTSKPQKQNWLNRLFTGKILYKINSCWKSDIVFSPRNRKSIIMRCTAPYEADARTLTKNVQYRILDTESKQKITINL